MNYLVVVALWLVALATHNWRIIEAREGQYQAYQFFYAMQGLSSVSLLLALAYFSGRTLTPILQALLTLLIIYTGTQESLVFVCGLSSYIQHSTSLDGGRLCNRVHGWDWLMILWCLGLWAAALGASRVVQQLRRSMETVVGLVRRRP